MPYLKSLLFNTIALEILHEDDDGRTKYLKSSEQCLVEFQKEVGTTPVTLDSCPLPNHLVGPEIILPLTHYLCIHLGTHPSIA